MKECIVRVTGMHTVCTPQLSVVVRFIINGNDIERNMVIPMSSAFTFEDFIEELSNSVSRLLNQLYIDKFNKLAREIVGKEFKITYSEGE